MSNSHSFTIYNASAGSGKTYTLTKEYLKILFNSPSDDAYKRILAITFTNKAVEEMKTRVVNSLFEFSKDTISEKSLSLLKDLSVETGLSLATIKDKSKAIIKNIIHNYSAFGISTIDKFTHKIIRTFAQDLELPANFEIALDTEALLQEAVDSVIAKVGEDEKLTQFILEFTRNKTDDDKNWDISYELLDVARLLTNENNSNEILALSDKDFEDFKEIKKKLEENIKQRESNCIQIASSCLNTINENINAKSFYSSYVPKFLQKISEGNLAINTNVIKYLDGEKERYSKSVLQNDKNWIDENAEKVLFDILQINKQVGRINFYKAFSQNINSLSLLNAINLEFKRIQEEQNILSIADFNKIISNKIKDEPTPFIYERLGEKYRHYFIDEFQDTSEMQWNNLIPLIDNALASEENNVKGTLMLVGDPKQSIYRWRGGKAEQFIDLSKEKNPFSNKDKKVENLGTNFRSFSNVIDFNNRFFTFLAGKFENKDYAELYEKTAIQKVNDKNGGYVNISFILAEEDEEFDEKEIGYSYKTLQYLEKTLETIIQLKEKGFNYGEIVLLTRKTNQGIDLANFLTENNIPILSSETLLIQNATEVKLIIALLRFLNNNKDFESKAYILYYIAKHKQNELSIHDFISKFKDKSETEIESELKKLNIQVSFKNCRTKSLYEAVEILVNSFVSEKANTSYVQYFMDLVLEKDSKAQLGITEFLEFWDKTGFKKSIPSPEGSDAVRIMTIHKSKGLEFPVVIYPFAEDDLSRNKGNKIWVEFDEEDAIDFPKAYINAKSEVDTYSENAKKIYLEKSQEEFLDTVNVLYVALTRAEEQLYIISNKLTNKKTGNFIQNNLTTFFLDFLINENKYNEEDLVFEFGNSERVSIQNLKENKSKQIELVQDKFPFSQIKIAQKEALLWDTEQQKAINFGNVIHEILAYIEKESDVSIAMEKAIESGIISLKEKNEIENQVYKIVYHEDLKDFYSNNGIIYNEKTIIDIELGNIKPDKIVILNQTALLLDYKTGEKLNSHKIQIENYAQALERMNYKVVKKALVYIGDKVEVVIL